MTLSTRPSSPPELTPATAPERADVVVLGGGITGLTLALQLRQARPETSVLVIEKATHPVAEAAHKVGESSVEIQAEYLRNVLDLGDHLDGAQLRKFGLRMFFPQGSNTDIARRVEFGQIEEAPLPSYQLDRGRLENHLAGCVVEAGAILLGGHRVERVDLGEDGEEHVVHFSGAAAGALRARWVIDATGRAAMLKRQLGLAKPLEHHANASWFRVAHPIDVGQWSQDEQWQARVPSGLRRLSTNHLMGPSYWVWMIPLASDATSIGIVAEESAHPHSEFNTREKALAWLQQREPQLSAELAQHHDKILDFRVMRDYAYGCTQVYDGARRWCLTGEAGVSIDPLYSSGGDLMAIGNGLVTDLVTRDLNGEDVSAAAAGHNQIYLLMSEIWLIAYLNQYPVMGNPRVMVAKVVWDTIIYWAVPGLLFFHDSYRTLVESTTALPALYRTWEVHTRVQQVFREWSAVDTEASSDTFADPYSLLEFMVDLHTGMAAGLERDQLEAKLCENVALLERLGGQLVEIVSERVRRVNPTPQARQQVDAWRDDELLSALRNAYQRTRSDQPIDPAWITLGDRADIWEMSA